MLHENTDVHSSIYLKEKEWVSHRSLICNPGGKQCSLSSVMSLLLRSRVSRAVRFCSRLPSSLRILLWCLEGKKSTSIITNYIHSCTNLQGGYNTFSRDSLDRLQTNLLFNVYMDQANKLNTLTKTKIVDLISRVMIHKSRYRSVVQFISS